MEKFPLGIKFAIFARKTANIKLNFIITIQTLVVEIEIHTVMSSIINSTMAIPILY
jgi:hypothetical protein